MFKKAKREFILKMEPKTNLNVSLRRDNKNVQKKSFKTLHERIKKEDESCPTCGNENDLRRRKKA